MRRAIRAALLAAVCVSASSCGTASRYEYYDYGGKTVDERNDERGQKIDRSFRGVMPNTSRGYAR